MAAPLAHIFLAAQVLAGPLQHKFNIREFIVGTSFPDIRYLNVLRRNATHYQQITWNDILQQTDSFQAGLMFHSLVDLEREKHVVANNLYAQLPQSRFITQMLKFAEDELLRPYIDIAPYISYFDECFAQERAYDVADKDIRRWHRFLQKYLQQTVSGTTLLVHFFDLHKPQAWRAQRLAFAYWYAPKLHKMVHAIACNNKVRTSMLDFYLNFTKHLII